MEIIEKKVKELVPYKNNPRKNEEAVEYVANSIKEFGFKVPVVIDKNNVIVAGHTRLKAAEMLGLDIVPCIVADDLTEEQVRAFRLADNKVAEMSRWDNAKMMDELDAILGFDMSEFGFDVGEDPEDLSENLIEKFDVIIIECPDERNMEETFEKLTEEGYKCRLSTL